MAPTRRRASVGAFLFLAIARERANNGWASCFLDSRDLVCGHNVDRWRSDLLCAHTYCEQSQRRVMTEIWALAALWLGLALVATLLSIWLRIATALSEIVVGTIAQLVIGAVIGGAVLGTDQTWVKFLSGTGAILLTFLAGAELDPTVFRQRWKEAGAIGVIS